MRAATMGMIVLMGAAGPALAAPAAREAEIVSPQNPESDVETLWRSETSRTDCVNALTTDADGPEPAACTRGTVAKLARGTSVRTLASSETCGALKSVRVLSGKHTGKTGCLAAAGVKAAGARKPPL